MPKKTAYQAKIEHIQILDEQGKLDAALNKGGLGDEDAVFLYEQMTVSRTYDEIAFKLQRSGRMGTYPQNKGQEAGPGGIGLAVLHRGKKDWLVPCYRENLALFLNGLPMEKILLHWMGDERGNQIPEGVHILPISIPIGTHPLHACGLAFAEKYRKTGRAAVTFFGDGATSEGDFHEACNFASAMKLPVVFFCQNNFWAISVPRAIQTGSETIAQKGLAYGMPCFQIDGNDIFASYKVGKDALELAVEESRPVFIEAITYRLGDHTTADDARRYRDSAELESWQKKDPLIRTRKYLESKKLWNDKKQADLEARAKKLTEEVVRKAEGIEKPGIDDIFDYTFAELNDELRTQKRTLRTASLAQHPEQERLSR
ncbi:MAG: pyruvate dehydrogenase (acetyl-transferring) E1 component subunit alpha [Phycisphaerales bacterium]|nr:pyruvate dehydrogenase (acetyl-transferring) E1 component subunit alpha [Phycisphaerales bacterium]